MSTKNASTFLGSFKKQIQYSGIKLNLQDQPVTVSNVIKS